MAQSVSVPIRVGVSLSSFVPSPSWPLPLYPHAQSELSVFKANEWLNPVVIIFEEIAVGALCEIVH